MIRTPGAEEQIFAPRSSVTVYVHEKAISGYFPEQYVIPGIEKWLDRAESVAIADAIRRKRPSSARWTG